MTDAPAGWYPVQAGVLRYWDGAMWTEHHASATAPPVVAKEKVSVAALLVAMIPLAGIIGGVLTLVNGKQPKTGALMLAIGFTSMFVLMTVRTLAA